MDGLEDQLTAACEVLDGRDSPLISSLERNRTEQGPRPANRADTAHESEKGEGVVLPLERKGQCVLPNETIKAHEGPPSGNGRVLEGQDNASQPSSAPPTYPSSTLSRQVLLQSSSRGFVDVQTNDEELVFFGEDSVANVSQELACDPILLAHELAVREESRARRLPEDLSPRARDSDEVLVSAAQHGLRSAVTNYDAKCTATLKQPDIDSKERKTSRPIGWAATFDMVGSGDVVATRHVPKPPHLSSNEPIALKPPRVACAEDPTLVERHEEFAELQRMQRFNERRSRKVRAMQERRRLEKEHRAALRAGAFEDVENVVTIDDFKSVSKAGTARKAPCTIPRCAPGVRKISNRRNISNARQTAPLPHYDSMNESLFLLRRLSKSVSLDHIVRALSPTHCRLSSARKRTTMLFCSKMMPFEPFSGSSHFTEVQALQTQADHMQMRREYTGVALGGSTSPSSLLFLSTILLLALSSRYHRSPLRSPPMLPSSKKTFTLGRSKLRRASLVSAPK